MSTSHKNTHSAVGFEDLDSLLLNLNAFGSASELHGLLCGQFCAGLRPGQSDWISTVVDILDIEDVSQDRDRVVLSTLYDQVLVALTGLDFEFELLLPDDDTPIFQRVDALSQWCQGFLTGFGLAGNRVSNDDYSEDVQEALKDIVNVSQLDTDVDDDDDNESDFVTLLEHIRLSILMVFADCNEKDGVIGRTLH